MTVTTTPPQRPDSSEADPRQLRLAEQQGAAYRAALDHMSHEVADTGGTARVADYLVGYAIEEAEGMYMWRDGELVWRNPQGENAHIEVAVCDAADGRFIPALRVTGTLVADDGDSVGPFDLPLLWHPMLYHYGADVTVPRDGTYTLRVHADAPTFPRHDELNGLRFASDLDVEFEDVHIERGAEPVDPPHGVPTA